MAEKLHRYRSHTCGALRASDIGGNARLSGWVHRVRDHGGVLFIDLRDHYGLTQCVIDPDSPAFAQAEKLRSEWVIRLDGEVRKRPAAVRIAPHEGRRECDRRPRDWHRHPNRVTEFYPSRQRKRRVFRKPSSVK